MRSGGYSHLIRCAGARMRGRVLRWLLILVVMAVSAAVRAESLGYLHPAGLAREAPAGLSAGRVGSGDPDKVAACQARLLAPHLIGHRVVYRAVSGRRGNVHMLIYGGFCAPQQPTLPYHSAEHPYLSKLAEAHAGSMARRCHQDHAGFAGGRSSWIMYVAGCSEASEICAESWPGQTLWQAAIGSWKDWSQSPSHWRTANGKPALYGAGTARGRDGIWYSCIVAAWGR